MMRQQVCMKYYHQRFSPYCRAHLRFGHSGRSHSLHCPPMSCYTQKKVFILENSAKHSSIGLFGAVFYSLTSILLVYC